MRKKRLTFGYVVLVGLPLLFLAGTLRAGKSLSAPASVSGVWAIQSEQSPPHSMTIVQTGPQLLVTMHSPDQPPFAAEIANGRITAPGFEARVSDVSGRRSIDGRLSGMSFHAVRTAPAEK